MKIRWKKHLIMLAEWTGAAVVGIAIERAIERAIENKKAAKTGKLNV